MPAYMPEAKSVEWYTPRDLFNQLDGVFKFNVDVCAMNQEASRLPNFFSPEQDGLKQDWSGLRCWMNPPYGRGMNKWIDKASNHDVVALLPVRSDTQWFHRNIPGVNALCFVKGRVKFETPDGTVSYPAPFPTMLAVFGFWKTPIIGLSDLGWWVPFEG